VKAARWYNRVAAWLADLIVEPLLALAAPAWEEEEAREIEQERAHG